MGVIFLTVSPDKVDVNVHPTKAEVRFEDKGIIFRAVGKAARRSLLAHTPVPEVSRISGVNLWGGFGPGHGRVQRSIDPAWSTLENSSRGDILQSGPGSDTLPGPLGSPILRLIGQVAASYLVAEGPDGLYLIDQHAAHERILFEKLLEQRAERPASQVLLDAVVVDFTPASADLLNENLDLLQELGFEIEEFGASAFKLRSIPVLLMGGSPEAVLRAAVEDLEVDETPLEKNREELIIARVCKRAAVKAGQVLSPEEQKQLVLDLERCQSPRTCPHGRPTMIHLSVDLLEKKFGRSGPL